MPRSKAVDTIKLQVTIDVNTDRLVGEIATLGIHGVNKAEVASTIIRLWIWENLSKLRDSGVVLRDPPP